MIKTWILSGFQLCGGNGATLLRAALKSDFRPWAYLRRTIKIAKVGLTMRIIRRACSAPKFVHSLPSCSIMLAAEH